MLEEKIENVEKNISILELIAAKMNKSMHNLAEDMRISNYEATKREMMLMRQIKDGNKFFWIMSALLALIAIIGTFAFINHC